MVTPSRGVENTLVELVSHTGEIKPIRPIRPANEFYNVKVVPNEMTANRQCKRLRMP